MPICHSRVVVTGGAGFIGSHLVDVLLKTGNEVIVIDDFSSGSRANLSPHQGNANLHVEEANILDEKALRKLVKGVNFVFHLATRNVRMSLHQPTIVHEVNATGTLNLLKAAAAARVQRFLYCSSSEVIGTVIDVPSQEKYHFHPETIYGASKLIGEYYTQVFQRAQWLSTVIARPFNNYGPREHYEGIKGEVIPRFILWALAGLPLTIFGDGKQTRDFTYVTETAEILADLIECKVAEGRVFNVCRGEEVSILHLATIINALTENRSSIRTLPGRPSDVLRLFGDNTRLRNVLGKAPSISIREGISKTVTWFQEHVQPSKAVLASLDLQNWCNLPTEPWLLECKGQADIP